MYKFPVIKLSYYAALLPRNTDDITGVISDQVPKPSLRPTSEPARAGFPATSSDG